MPFDDSKGWPGRREANLVGFEQKAGAVEARLLNDVSQEMGSGFDRSRFIPFVAMHEFEGILFSDCTTFADSIGRPDITAELQEIRDQFSNPEEINDSSTTAPSKRIQRLMPNYSKVIHGNKAALEIGLTKIKGACPHFQEWLERLEALSGA
jgi:hypothetical protein